MTDRNLRPVLAVGWRPAESSSGTSSSSSGRSSGPNSWSPCNSPTSTLPGPSAAHARQGQRYSDSKNPLEPSAARSCQLQNPSAKSPSSSWTEIHDLPAPSPLPKSPLDRSGCVYNGMPISLQPRPARRAIDACRLVEIPRTSGQANRQFPADTGFRRFGLPRLI
eukprot:3933989-Rhodomonas_salina.2